MDPFQWDVSPEITSFWIISIRYYSLLFACAFLLGFRLMLGIYLREKRSEEELDSLFIYMFFGTIIGARLGHCFFYDPTYYFSNPLEILKVWKGGLASHGAAIGMLIALFMFSKGKNRPTYLWTLDRMTIPVSIGATFVRLGNFFNSEIVGVQTDQPWGIVFKRYLPDPNHARHPVQLYESLSYLFLFILLYWIYKSDKFKKKDGFIFGFFLLILFTSRFFLEFLKTQQAYYEENLDLLVGQWLSIPFILVGLALILGSKFLSWQSGENIRKKFKRKGKAR